MDPGKYANVIIIGAGDMQMATAQLAAAMGISHDQAQYAIEQALEPRAPTPNFAELAAELTLENIKVEEYFGEYDRDELQWIVPRRIGKPTPLPTRRFQDVHRTRSRTHSQYKYSWRKMKPKKYRP